VSETDLTSFRTISNSVREVPNTCRKVSEKVSNKCQNMSNKCPNNVKQMSNMCTNKIPKVSNKFSTSLPKMSNRCPKSAFTICRHIFVVFWFHLRIPELEALSPLFRLSNPIEKHSSCDHRITCENTYRLHVHTIRTSTYKYAQVCQYM
jgi:hypothetical protein